MSRPPIVKFAPDDWKLPHRLTDEEREGRTAAVSLPDMVQLVEDSQQLQRERSTHYMFGKLKEHLGKGQFFNNE